MLNLPFLMPKVKERWSTCYKTIAGMYLMV
jgi:hypothetical protein